MISVRANALQMLILRPPSAVHCRTRELYWKTQMLSLLEISMDWWAFGKPMTSEIGSMASQSHTVGTETGLGSDFGWSRNLYLTQEHHYPDSKIKFYGNRTSDGRFRSKNRFGRFTALHNGNLIKNLPKNFEFLARDI